MDSILELEQSEIQFFQEQIKSGYDLWKQHSAEIFEDCFLMLTSSNQAKPESFKILRQIAAVKEEEGESETQVKLSALFDATLNIVGQVFRMGVREAGEFQLILDDIGLKGKKGAPVQ